MYESRINSDEHWKVCVGTLDPYSVGCEPHMYHIGDKNTSNVNTNILLGPVSYFFFQKKVEEITVESLKKMLGKKTK